MTTTFALPVAGASRDHISTRRVFPASLCAPMKVSAVPSIGYPRHAGRRCICDVDGNSDNQQQIRAAVVWAKVRVFMVLLRVADPEVAESTATCALTIVVANNSSRHKNAGPNRPLSGSPR